MLMAHIVYGYKDYHCFITPSSFFHIRTTNQKQQNPKKNTVMVSIKCVHIHTLLVIGQYGKFQEIPCLMLHVCTTHACIMKVQTSPVDKHLLK